MLEALGLDDAHTAVYRSVLAVPSASAKEVSASVGMPVGRARTMIGELERLGLLARQASQPDRVVASPPAIALKPLLLERERGLTRAHEALIEFSELYREAADQRNAADVVDVILGTDAVRQRIGQLQAAANREVRVLVLSQVAIISGAENVEEDRALERGVRYRVVVEGGVLERPGFLDVARSVGALGEEIRVLPTLPTRMFIADDAMALLPMRSHGENSSLGALLVHPSGLLDLVMAIFEEYWKTATRLLPDDNGAQDGVDRDVLKLLLLGLTDATIAAQLRISVRTLQRRVAELMELAAVTTRIQLGAEAVRRGWI
ncbi:helix-turn-helix domain-containing protein [Microbacterium pumilum]|uniref:LuxR family transcriptional regulator n=1 Tax=Microbacterium pumilum TaxID=344165 RepID=A0ABN2ST36_9MICO